MMIIITIFKDQVCCDLYEIEAMVLFLMRTTNIITLHSIPKTLQSTTSYMIDQKQTQLTLRKVAKDFRDNSGQCTTSSLANRVYIRR